MQVIKITDEKLEKEVDQFEGREWSKADLEHYGKVKPTKIHHKFVIREEDKIIGMLELSIETNVACIEGLLVDSEFRGRGVGQQLIKTAEEFAKSSNCTKIYLETGKGWDAEAFYKKMGYEITAELKSHIFETTGLLMTKFIRS